MVALSVNGLCFVFFNVMFFFNKLDFEIKIIGCLNMVYKYNPNNIDPNP